MKIFLCAITFIVASTIFARSAEDSYPGLALPNIYIGMSEGSLLLADKDIKAIGTDVRSSAILKRGQQNFIFYLENKKLIQIAYGWEGLDEDRQKETTRALIQEFEKRYGKAEKVVRTRAGLSAPIRVGARKYVINDSAIAILESWDQTISIIITYAKQFEDAEKKITASLEKLQQKSQNDSSKRKSGVIDFSGGKLEKKNDSQKHMPQQAYRDFVQELNDVE